ncbi:MAG: hypothetical protein HRT88_01115 [Lentisphaeraceae bacterium]|nr:hypothetical protein [Lentisphaeraceae bacterium]
MNLDDPKFLWHLLELLQSGASADKICELLSIQKRQLNKGVLLLKECGASIQYRRATFSYEVDWPERNYSLELTSREFFQVRYMLTKSPLESFSEKVKLSSGAGIYLDLCGTGLQKSGASPELIKALQHRIGVQFLLSGAEPCIMNALPLRIVHADFKYYLFCANAETGKNLLLELEQVKYVKIGKDVFEAPVNADGDLKELLKVKQGGGDTGTGGVVEY